MTVEGAQIAHRKEVIMDLVTDEDAVDFDVRAAFDELFTTNRTTDYNPNPARTRGEWAANVRGGNIRLPPPQWWLDQQVAKGRKAPAHFAIWNKSYDYGRQLSIWVMAPLEDFRKAKFLRPISAYRTY